MTDVGAMLFEPFVAYESVRFAPEDASRFAEVDVPPELERAVEVRRTEYRAGRSCAARALARVAARGSVGRDADGAPVWPPGVVGAITHARGFAAAAVARASEARGLGLDVEPVPSASATVDVATAIANPLELERLRDAGLDAETLVTLVFSAKESVYKCLRPLVGRYFGFREATVVAARVADGTLAVELGPELGAFAGRTVTGRFVLADGLVHTGVLLRQSSSEAQMRRTPLPTS